MSDDLRDQVHRAWYREFSDKEDSVTAIVALIKSREAELRARIAAGDEQVLHLAAELRKARLETELSHHRETGSAIRAAHADANKWRETCTALEQRIAEMTVRERELTDKLRALEAKP